MYYKIGKKIFHFLSDFLQFFRVFLVFLSFFTILYWFFQLGEATFIQPLTPFFDAMKDIIHIFYQRTVEISGSTVDFSFLAATLAMILTVWVLKFAVEYIQIAEKKYDDMYNVIKKKEEKLFNKELDMEFVSEEYKNNKILLLIKFSALNLAKDCLFERDLDAGVEDKQNEFLQKFSQKLVEITNCEKELLEEGCLLYFNDFSKVNKVILCVENTLQTLKKEFREEKWQIFSYMAIDAYGRKEEVASKTQKLTVLIKLGLKDKILCLSTFKNRYFLVRPQNYLLAEQGFYTIKEKNEEVFYIKSLI